MKFIAALTGNNIELPSGLSITDTYRGTVIGVTAGTALVFGDLCYLDPTDGKWEKTDANSASGADGDCRGIIGMCVAPAADNDPTLMLLSGIVRADAVFPALTVNAPIYADEVLGKIVVVQPSTPGVVIRVVGFGWDANTLCLNPSPMYITHV